MSPSRRPLSVDRLARVLCLCLMLATWLPAWPAQSAANPTPSAGSPADRIPTEVWQVTWKASIDGNATTSELNLTRQTRINASIIVNFYADGTSEYYANEYTATYLYSSRWEYFCSYGGRQLNYDLFRVTDPGRYNGTGPIAANGVMPLRPVEYEGKWILPAINMSLGPFTLSKHQENQECKEPFYSSDRTDSNSHLYLDYVTYMFGSLTSDNNAVFESQLTTETPMETYDVPYTLDQQNYLRVERLKGQNLKVHDIEVTQGLQLNNTIPLVQGRSTIVRAYIDIGAAAGPIAKVGARLKVYGGGGLLGERWPLNKGGVISAKRTPDWHKFDDTLNFAIPWIWTQSPSLRFEVEVNHTRLLYETDYTDNKYSVELPLRDCQPLEIGYLPVRFAPPGVTPSSPDPAIAFAHEWMVRVYPVADDELLYQPLPGITWKRKIDGLTQSETLENGAVLLDSLDQLESLSTAPSSSLWAVAWLPGAASQWLDGMSATGDPWRGQRGGWRRRRPRGTSGRCSWPMRPGMRTARSIPPQPPAAITGSTSTPTTSSRSTAPRACSTSCRIPTCQPKCRPGSRRKPT